MITSQTKSAIRRMYAHGKTQQEIALHFNLSQGWINKILNNRLRRIKPTKTKCDGIWTDEQIMWLKALWLKGYSASKIAHVLEGKTRDAVIGKAHRLGLAKRPSPIHYVSAPQPAQPR